MCIISLLNHHLYGYTHIAYIKHVYVICIYDHPLSCDFRREQDHFMFKMHNKMALVTNERQPVLIKILPEYSGFLFLVPCSLFLIPCSSVPCSLLTYLVLDHN
jgi:hypothetical protein